jgi:hypothetical protein
MIKTTETFRRFYSRDTDMPADMRPVFNQVSELAKSSNADSELTRLLATVLF